MKVSKKYTAIQIGTKEVNDNVDISLSYGEITGTYYDRDYPKEEFDTEQEAIENAYKHCKYSKWMIVPVVSF